MLNDYPVSALLSTYFKFTRVHELMIACQMHIHTEYENLQTRPATTRIVSGTPSPLSIMNVFTHASPIARGRRALKHDNLHSLGLALQRYHQWQSTHDVHAVRIERRVYVAQAMASIRSIVNLSILPGSIA